jgi:hypothetical protein
MLGRLWGDGGVVFGGLVGIIVLHGGAWPHFVCYPPQACCAGVHLQ